jgi:hypothetical protein
LQQLYKTKELDRERSESVEADFEEVAASCGHFSFSLQAVAAEMQTFLLILEDLKEQNEQPNDRSWNWLRFWRNPRWFKGSRKTIQEDEEPLIEPSPGQAAQLPKVPKDDPALDRRDERKWRDLRKKPKGFYLRGLRAVRWLKRDDSMFTLL